MSYKSVTSDAVKDVRSRDRLDLIKQVAQELVRRRATEQEIGTHKQVGQQIKPALGSGCQAQLNDCTKDSSSTEKQGTL